MDISYCDIFGNLKNADKHFVKMPCATMTLPISELTFESEDWC